MLGNPSTRSPNPLLPPHLINEGIEWLVVIEYSEPSAQQRQAFETWYNTSPLHQQVWQQVANMDQAIERLKNPINRQTLSHLENHRHQRRKLLKGLAGGLFIATGTSLTAYHYAPWHSLTADHATRTGQQKPLQLPDGTQLLLNTRTAISLAFTTQERLIHLHQGELLITTGKDAEHTSHRPFRVVTPVGTVTALGTRFSLRQLADATRIEVEEGQVALLPGNHPSFQFLAQPGEYWALDRNTARQLPPSPFPARDWQAGLLNARNLPLPQLLEELQRYHQGKITWDGSITSLKVSGVYHLQDTRNTLQFLAQTQPIQLRPFTPYWTRISRA